MRRFFDLFILALALAVGFVAITLGFLYEQQARHTAQLIHPLPGRAVDIGGRRLQLDCRGSGAPTIVLEAGFDLGGALAWTAVHDGLARQARTCAYSRAGLAGSDPSAIAFDATTVAEDLERLLAVSGEAGPWLVVAHSVGAPLALRFVRRNGARVVGLVLIDPSHPDQLQRLARLAPDLVQGDDGLFRLLAATRAVGLPRLLLQLAPARPGQPEMAAALERRHAPPTFAAALREYRALPAVLAAAKRDTLLGDLPLLILGSTRPVEPRQLGDVPDTAAAAALVVEEWHRMHREMAAWSSRGRAVVVAGAGHYVHEYAPALVVRAITELRAASSCAAKP